MSGGWRRRHRRGCDSRHWGGCLSVTGYNVQKVLSIPKAAQVELDSPTVSTLSLVHKMEGRLWSDPSPSGKSEKKRQRNS